MMEKSPAIVFATNNSHKLEEARRIAGGRIRILSLADINCHDEIPETAPDLEGNSLQKAGRPAALSARYAGEHCSPDDNIDKLLAELQGIDDRKACFRTVVTLLQDDREPLLFEGCVEGRISDRRHGTAGFGYDPVFIADESGLAFAEMSADDKNTISHRGRAMRQLFDYLLK